VSLEARNLYVRLAGRLVLRGVTLRARPGELTVILGPNGAGKTTLLKTLACILTPLQGSVTLDGRDVCEMSMRERARLISYVPSVLPEPGLGQLTAEFVAASRYPLHRGLVLGPTREDLEEAVKVLAELSGENIAWRPLALTSSGERQKAIIAHGLARKPKVLLVDEPTSFLDLSARLLLYTKLLEEAHRGTIVVAATHDMILAALYASRVILLRDGRVFAEGRPEDVLTEDILEKLYGIHVKLVNVDGKRIPIPVAAVSLRRSLPVQ
jgi:iron complex transport system ATP-binding protein